MLSRSTGSTRQTRAAAQDLQGRTDRLNRVVAQAQAGEVAHPGPDPTGQDSERLGGQAVLRRGSGVARAGPRRSSSWRSIRAASSGAWT